MDEKEMRMADSEKYIEDIKKYTAAVNEGAVAGIVRHCGIALRNRDSSFVASTDPEELKRVRESWLKSSGLPKATPISTRPFTPWWRG